MNSDNSDRYFFFGGAKKSQSLHNLLKDSNGIKRTYGQIYQNGQIEDENGN